MNLKDYVANVPNFPKEGIQFKDITPLRQTEKHITLQHLKWWNLQRHKTQN